MKTYRIVSGRKNVAIFNEPLDELVDYEEGEVVSDEFGTNVKIHCVNDEEEADGSIRTYMVFSEAISQELYTGFFSAVVAPESENDRSASLSDGYSNTGHSGSKSLKVTNDVSFRQYFLDLEPNKYYYLSAWVTNDPEQFYYETPVISGGLGLTVTFKNKVGATVGSTEIIPPTGAIIEGWQQISGEVLVPAETEYFELGFKAGSGGIAYYDDLRLFPSSGNMNSYVYDEQYRVTSALDENNFATYYSYDGMGKLHLLKKETERGVQTIQESVSYTLPNENNNAATNE